MRFIHTVIGLVTGQLVDWTNLCKDDIVNTNRIGTEGNSPYIHIRHRNWQQHCGGM